MSTFTKTRLAGTICAVSMLILAGCNLPSNLLESTPDATGVFFTAVALMTEKAGTTSAISTQPATTPVPEVITPTAGASPVIQATVVTQQPSPTLRCELARPGIPLDVTIPDDTRLNPGESFTKVWRFVNNGSCTWTRDYAVVWFSGDELGVQNEQRFLQQVAPGESVDLTVDMAAPNEPGVYSSYWMLRSDSGALFGLGPNGDAPFWVRIQVVAVSTATPTVTIAPSATPVVEASGSAQLQSDQSIDLDSGLLGQGDEDDIALELDEAEQYQLVPLNNARLGVFGMIKPGIIDCGGTLVSSDPVSLSDLQNGLYLCYRTNQGLPGALLLVKLPDQGDPLELEYLTWAAP